VQFLQATRIVSKEMTLRSANTVLPASSAAYSAMGFDMYQADIAPSLILTPCKSGSVALPAGRRGPWQIERGRKKKPRQGRGFLAIG
jgi:hypothetical protein